MEEQLKIDFDKVIKHLKPSKQEIELREKNLNEFIKNGFPNKRIEDWKFSDLNQIISSNIKELKFFNDETVPEKFDQSTHHRGCPCLDVEQNVSFQHNSPVCQ